MRQLICEPGTEISGAAMLSIVENVRSAEYLPLLQKYGYDNMLSSGTVVTGGTLGTVMPPSVVLIIIGLQTEQSSSN